MRTHLRLGSLTLRFRRGLLSRDGHPRLTIGDVSFWTHSNSGDLLLVSRHPGRSITWTWYVALGRRPGMFSARERARLLLLFWTGNPHVPAPSWLDYFSRRDKVRRSQWYDYYRLPLGGVLVVGRQKPTWR